MTIQKKIKKYIKNKKGQGALLATIIGSIVMSTIIASSTQWFLSMNKTMGATNERLEAMTIAMSEWQRLEHMSLDELEANRKNYKTPYAVGDKFKVGVTLGEQGYFDKGTCNSLTGSYASENANCFKDTIMTVYDKSGSALYTTRSLPLSVSRDSFPEGTILPYTGDLAKIPHGWVLCDGNNGTPDLTGRFLEGTKTTTGIFKDAGLPNITVEHSLDDNWMTPLSGAFTTGSNGSRGFPLTTDFLNSPKIKFDASLSNPIYGKSDTVQPPAYTVFYIMKTNKDFHYNHTNGAPTPNIYTKEEVDALLKDLNNKVSDTYLPINSSKYVRNLTTQYTLGLGYNGNDKTIHGYLGGTDTPFASNSPSPEMFDDRGSYYKFPNGLIMQWGIAKDIIFYDSYNYSVNFPVAFPNKCLSVTGSIDYKTNVSGVMASYIWNISKTEFTIQNDAVWDIYPQGSYSWFAIGY